MAGIWSSSEEEKEGNMETREYSPSLIQETEPTVATQPVQKPLEGVLVYVDVRSGIDGTINMGCGLQDTLIELGALVSSRLTKNVTHVIYKDGKSNIDRINRQNVFLVNPLWLDACKQSNVRVSEAKYPIREGGDGRSPIVLGRMKRTRSMQPKPFEKKVMRSVERKKKARQQLAKDNNNDNSPLPFVCPFEFHSTDEEGGENDCKIIDSRESTPDSLPPVDFTPKEVKRVCKTTSATPLSPQTENNKKSSPSTTVGAKKVKTATKSQRPLKDRNRTSLEKEEGEKGRKKGTMSIKLKPKPCAGMKEVSKKVQPVLKSRKTSTKKNDREREKKAEEKEKEEEELEEEEEEVKEKEKMVETRKVAKKRTSFEREKPTIVMTSISQENQGVVHVIVNKLGRFQLVHTVTHTTSHVISGATRRTINILAATAKGCWILPMDWVLKSLEAGHWLPEEAFEMTSEFPSAQFFRLERQQGGPLYKPTLFNSVGSIYISPNTKPLPQDLNLILSLAGAKITNSKLKADIIIGGERGEGDGDMEEKVYVSESWILDSITNHSLLSFDNFLIRKLGT